jgi:hypothetical protein
VPQPPRPPLSSLSPSLPAIIINLPISTLTLVANGVPDADGRLVADVGVLDVSKLQAGDPPVAGDVVDLLGDLGVVQGGQVGEGLEELCREREGEREERRATRCERGEERGRDQERRRARRVLAAFSLAVGGSLAGPGQKSST